MMLLPRRRRQVGAGGVGLLLGLLGLRWHDGDGVGRAGVLTYLPTAGLLRGLLMSTTRPSYSLASCASMVSLSGSQISVFLVVLFFWFLAF